MDATLKIHLTELEPLGIAKKWLTYQSPIDELRDECSQLMASSESAIRQYLGDHPVITSTVDSVLSQLAFSAGSKWEDTEAVLHPLARKGWHISRWLPTYLIVNGPIGLFLTNQHSPMKTILIDERSKYPLLCSCRDAFNNDLYRRVRNSFAHWSFVWMSDDQIELFNFQTGKPEGSVTLLQAESMHNVSAKIIEALDRLIFNPAPAQAPGG